MSAAPGTPGGFVHVEGGRLVDGAGLPLLMRGVGLGNWLLTEGYMWRFPREGPQSPRQIEALVVDLVGQPAADAFWRTFRDRFIAEADIARIAADGFDHVRVPMNARLLIDEDGELLYDGVALLDRLIEWCRTHGLRVVLDLHGAPGGQTGTNIDDSLRNLPDLFLVGGVYLDRTIALWTRLAERYRDETVVAGYDLLNEPLPFREHEPHVPALVTLYRDLTAAIRAVDPNHLLVYEGTRWATDWSLFREAWDPNAMLQFHKYWSAPDRPSIAPYLETGERLGLPVYMGEGGENGPEWLQRAFGLYEEAGISWNFWPWKKVGTWTSPYSVRPPEGWDAVVAYASGSGPRPSRDAARRTVDALLDAVRLEACEARPDVTNALFRRVPLRLAAAAFVRHEGAVVRHLGGGTPAFDHEDVPARVPEAFEVVLAPGGWVEYEVELGASSPLRIRMEVAPPSPDVALASPDAAAAATLVVGGVRLDVPPMGTAVATTEALPAGRVRVRVETAAHGLAIRALEVALAAPAPPPSP